MRRLLVLVSVGLAFCLGALSERVSDFATGALLGALVLVWLASVVLVTAAMRWAKGPECWLCASGVAWDAEVCPHCEADL